MFMERFVKDISIKPKDNCALPEEIEWMDKMKKIIISGESLDHKFFMKEQKYHASIELWSVDAVFSYKYKGETSAEDTEWLKSAIL